LDRHDNFELVCHNFFVLCFIIIPVQQGLEHEELVTNSFRFRDFRGAIGNWRTGATCAVLSTIHKKKEEPGIISGSSVISLNVQPRCVHLFDDTAKGVSNVIQATTSMLELLQSVCLFLTELSPLRRK